MMLTIEKDHRVKIDKAISMCETGFTQFVEYLEKCYQKKDASRIKYFLLQNTIFAGGVFRSVFTDTYVNDIDILFTSEDAAIEFRHIFATDPYGIFKDDSITNQQAYNWYNPKKKKPKKDDWTVPVHNGVNEHPTLSFITKTAGDPDEIIYDFNFTFNRHYFCLNDFHLKFDLDTFYKKGKIENAHTLKDPLTVFFQALRFYQEGFQISGQSMFSLVQRITLLNSGKELDYPDAIARITQGVYGKQAIPELALSYCAYNEDSYFNVDITNSPGKKINKLIMDPIVHAAPAVDWDQNYAFTTAPQGQWQVADRQQGQWQFENAGIQAAATQQGLQPMTAGRVVPQQQRPVTVEAIRGMLGEVVLIDDNF